MTVKQILNNKGREIVSMNPHETVGQAVQLLAEKNIGVVVIAGEDGVLAGILSERDIVRALAREGAQALGRPVTSFMTKTVETAREGDDIPGLMSRMTTGKFRHLPVLAGNRLTGIVSIGDVVKHRVAEMEAETRAMRDYITA